MKFDPDRTIQHAALEVSRVAHEGLGHTKFGYHESVVGMEQVNTSAEGRNKGMCCGGGLLFPSLFRSHPQHIPLCSISQ